MADYILRFCRQQGIHAKEDNTARKTKGNAGNVLAWPSGVNPDHPRLMLVSHMDTVDVGNAPAGYLKGGRIVTDGRHPAGLDNRLGVAILLNLLSEVKGDYVCAFTTQEEIGMYGAVAMRIPPGVKEIAVLDGSQSPGHGVLSTCGGMTFNVKLTGLASHAGIAPNVGRSAILMASRAIAKLKLGILETPIFF